MTPDEHHGTTGREVALSVLPFLDCPAAEFVRVAADVGFDSVSLRVAGSRTANPSELADPDRLAATVRSLADTGLGVIDAEVLRLGPDLGSDEITYSVDTAAALGARHLLVVDAGWSEQAPLVDQLSQVRALAVAAGVRPCLEFMKFTGCPNLDGAVAVAAESGTSVLVDTLHLFRSGGDAASLRAAVARYGADMFPYLQLCDAGSTPPADDQLRAEALTDRMLPGTGELPLVEVLQTLPAETPVAVEAPTAAFGTLAPRERAELTMRAVRRMGEAIRGWTPAGPLGVPGT